MDHERYSHHNLTLSILAKSKGFLLYAVNRYVKPICVMACCFISCFMTEWNALELLFLKLSHVFSLISQLLFFTMCEMALLGMPISSNEPEVNPPIVNGLSCLLFYTIFGYFVCKIRELCENRYIFPSRVNYRTLSFLKWILKIILEWVKTLGVVLCIQEKGVNIHINPLYFMITFAYYLSTETLFTELLVEMASKLKLQILEGMEDLYIPIVLNAYAIFASAVITAYLGTSLYLRYVLFASYFTLYLRAKYLYINYIKAVTIAQQTFASFKFASERDLKNWDDVCAVCLNRMSRAKITPCNHLFHSLCLRQCLKASLQCPLCKYNFTV